MRWGLVLRTLAPVWAALAVSSAGAQYGPYAPGYAPPPKQFIAQRAGADIDRRRLAAATDRLLPQRAGTIDAYVVVATLDSDPVFGREARETAKVLARRYGAEGRTLVLAGLDGHDMDPLPRGGPETLTEALNRVGALMDPAEDVLILYITAHGSPSGLAYRDHGDLLAILDPDWLDLALRRTGARNRLVLISACFSGLFVPKLATPTGAVITAAAADRTSFGCASDNDWTFFGDALVNHAFRKNQPLGVAFGEARAMIGRWEASGKLIPSNPQIAIGAQVATWLAPLELGIPKLASAPVGRPATDAIQSAIAANH